MDFLPQLIEEYSCSHTQDETPLLAELNRETHLKVLSPRMLSGHLQGRFLSMISHMIKPRKILEIGTYTGYSALCLAEGLADDGELITIDNNPELEQMIQHYFDLSPAGKKMHLMIGDARQIMAQLNGPFDLVFIDADKESYSLYFDLIIDHVRQGGYILADNVLWSGKVVETVKSNDHSTKAILEFNAKVHADERVENLLLPIRDGIMIMRKK